LIDVAAGSRTLPQILFSFLLLGAVSHMVYFQVRAGSRDKGKHSIHWIAIVKRF
jgi:hypothetical protein